MMAMIRYKAHNQYALTMNATSRIHFKGDIRHYSTVTGSVDLGIAGCFSCCYFFYIGGILPLPYQFYHHAHKMLCDHDQSEKLFLSDTDRVKCNTEPIITLRTTLTVPLPVL